MGDEVFSVWSITSLANMGLEFTPENISFCMVSQGTPCTPEAGWCDC
jgi:hypothetical protein